MATVGLLHPGEMGAAVGSCLVTAGHTVLWDPAGRSRATTGRALAAELTGTSLDSVVSRSSVIFSVCPPHAALDVAQHVAAAGFGGVYVDANAISVATAAPVASVVTAAGAAYLPFTLVLAVLSRWSGGLLDRFGARGPLIVGPTLAALGFWRFPLTAALTVRSCGRWPCLDLEWRSPCHP